jgi:UDP-glucose 4-epimerase
VDAVVEVTGCDLPVRPGPRRPGDPAVLVASNRLIATELGWRPTRTTLARMVSDAWEFEKERVAL